jgi:hypothetical protein
MKCIRERKEGEDVMKWIKERGKDIRDFERTDVLLETKPVSKLKCDDLIMGHAEIVLSIKVYQTKYVGNTMECVTAALFHTRPKYL